MQESNNFTKRKKEILSKKDKSSKKSYDEKILDLCWKINNLKNYYTTSSCAGRAVIMLDKNKKQKGVFLFVSHELLTFSRLKKTINNIKIKKPVKFKQEPCILHVACRSFNDASVLLKKAQLSGFKRAGIIASGKRFICELLSTEKLEFPLMKKGRLLVDDEFLKIIVKKSNENLKKSWKKIEKLEKIL